MDSAVDILLVEDNPYDEELTLHVLRKHRLAPRIEIVRDGAAALDFIFCTGSYAGRNVQDQPKIVLLDLKLPKVDGLEVLRRIKSHPGSRMIPVVVLTSSDQERDILESYELGTNSYIVKPVDFEQFTRAVEQLGRYWLLMNRSPDSSTRRPADASQAEGCGS
jgi:two-component system response regulator